jgi:hypothetical protein
MQKPGLPIPRTLQQLLPVAGSPLSPVLRADVLKRLAAFADRSLAVARLSGPGTSPDTAATPTAATAMSAADFGSLQMLLVHRARDEFSARLACEEGAVHADGDDRGDVDSGAHPATELLTDYSVALLGHAHTAVNAAVAYIEGRGFMDPSEEGCPMQTLAESLHACVVGLLLPGLATALQLLFDDRVALSLFPLVSSLVRKLDLVCGSLTDVAASSVKFAEDELRMQEQQVGCSASAHAA